MDMTLDRSFDTDSRVTICRREGSEASARLRLLGFDGCEFDTDVELVPGEQVSIHIYRMGSIRARITARHDRVVEAAFENECPV